MEAKKQKQNRFIQLCFRFDSMVFQKRTRKSWKVVVNLSKTSSLFFLKSGFPLMDWQEASDSGDGEKQMPCACTLFESRANVLYVLSVPIQFALLLFRYKTFYVDSLGAVRVQLVCI